LPGGRLDSHNANLIPSRALSAQDIRDELPKDVALCVFRV